MTAKVIKLYEQFGDLRSPLPGRDHPGTRERASRLVDLVEPGVSSVSAIRAFPHFGRPYAFLKGASLFNTIPGDLVRQDAGLGLWLPYSVCEPDEDAVLLRQVQDCVVFHRDRLFYQGARVKGYYLATGGRGFGIRLQLHRFESVGSLPNAPRMKDNALCVVAPGSPGIMTSVFDLAG